MLTTEKNRYIVLPAKRKEKDFVGQEGETAILTTNNRSTVLTIIHVILKITANRKCAVLGFKLKLNTKSNSG